MKNPVPQFKLVQVQWIDSATTPGWSKANELNDEPMLIWSTGWVVYEDKTILCLAAHISDNGRFCDVMTIPKVAIQR